MIPKYDKEKYDKYDFFIVDECDSIMLDQCMVFFQNYLSMQARVGGFFFLTATKFEEGEGYETAEQRFVTSLPNLKSLKCDSKMAKNDRVEKTNDFKNVDDMTTHIK